MKCDVVGRPVDGNAVLICVGVGSDVEVWVDGTSEHGTKKFVSLGEMQYA